MKINVDAIQFDSNDPGEDRFCIREQWLQNSGQEVKAYAVIDGHGGFLAADMTCECAHKTTSLRFLHLSPYHCILIHALHNSNSCNHISPFTVSYFQW